MVSWTVERTAVTWDIFFILLAIAILVEFELVNWVIFNSNFLKDSRPGISRSAGSRNTGIDYLLLI